MKASEVIGYIGFAAAVVALFFLYLFATPDQLSGEADLTAATETEVR